MDNEMQELAKALLDLMGNKHVKEQLKIDVDYVGQGTYNVTVWDMDVIRDAALGISNAVDS